MSRNQFSTIKLNNYTVRATTRGSLIIGGVAVGGGGGGGVVSDTSFTQGNRLAIFNETDPNIIKDTGIYHVFDEDNGDILYDPSGTNRIGLNTDEVCIQNEMNIVRLTSNRVRIASDNGNVRIRAANGVQIYSDIEMDGYRITDVGQPENSGDVATKSYVDNRMNTTFTQGNRLAIFNGENGNTITDTGIYHVFNEDNGAFLFSPTGSNFIQLDSGEVGMQNENTGNRVGVEENLITIRSYTGNVRIRGDTGVSISSELDMDDYKITNVANPTNPGDVATKGYVDNNTGGLSSQWVTLTQSDIQGLHVYPGKTLVEGVADNVIIVDSLEFIRGEQGIAYSATGVNMYVNYMGNYVDPAQSYTWKIPADAVQAGGTGLLTSTGGSQGISVNNASFQPVTVGQSAILMSDSAITGAGDAVTVKVNYRLSPRG